MSLPDISDLNAYGGALLDYSPVIDTTTDRSASGVNPAFNDIAAMTHTAFRAWVRFTLNGTAAPVLVAHDAVWGNALAVAPVVVRTGVGTVVATWPATVYDYIPNGQPGYFGGPHTVNLRDGFSNVRGSTFYQNQVTVTSANVATLYVANAAGTAADTAGATDFAIYVL